jgi:hypothetical protein
MRCPSFERLIDYLDNRLVDQDGERIAAHLATSCPNCLENRDWYLQTRSLAASDDSLEPPAWVSKRALRIFETQRPRLVERLGQAIAALVFDSFARPAVAGIRSTETTNRQLLYNAGDYSIDLQIARGSQAGAELVGQILREGEASFESVANLKLELAAEDQTVTEVFSNEMGEFTISGISRGVYDLRVETPEGSLTAKGIPVIQE